MKLSLNRTAFAASAVFAIHFFWASSCHRRTGQGARRLHRRLALESRCLRRRRIEMLARRPAESDHESSLRLDINFVSGAGFAGIRRDLPLDLPANFELAFSIRGDLPPNNLEFKLVDRPGNNGLVGQSPRFRVSARLDAAGLPPPPLPIRLGAVERRRSTQPPRSRSSSRPSKAATARSTSTISRSARCPSPSRIRARRLPRPAVQAGPDSTANFAMRRRLRNAMASRPRMTSSPSSQSISVRRREFGGLVVDWDVAAFPTQLRDSVLRRRRELDHCPHSCRQLGTPAVHFACPTPKPEPCVSSMNRSARSRATSRSAKSKSCRSKPPAMPNAFAAEIARRSPRGYYPRPFLGEGYLLDRRRRPGR